MTGAARAVGVERARRRLPAASSAAPSASGRARRERVEHGAIRLPGSRCANERVEAGGRGREFRPRRTGNASRHRREASPSAERGRGERIRPARAGSGAPIHGTPTTSASTGSSRSSLEARRARSSASACATEGGPPNAAVAASREPGRVRMPRRSAAREEREEPAQRRPRHALDAPRARAGSRGSAR